MSKAWVIAAALGLALAASGCAEMKGWTAKAEGSDGGTFMGGSAPVGADPAGSATTGTGSMSYSGADSRVDFSSGIGMDQ